MYFHFLFKYLSEAKLFYFYLSKRVDFSKVAFYITVFSTVLQYVNTFDRQVSQWAQVSGAELQRGSAHDWSFRTFPSFPHLILRLHNLCVSAALEHSACPSSSATNT